jgi:hypothetical protein
LTRSARLTVSLDGGGVATADRSLALASIHCVRRWRFMPAQKDGMPTAVVATMDLSFTLK